MFPPKWLDGLIVDFFELKAFNYKTAKMDGAFKLLIH